MPQRGLAEAACLLALLGFALAVAAPVLEGGVPVAADALKLWDPYRGTTHPVVNNQILADSVLQNLPWQVVVRRSIAAGEWPLWVPDIFAGYPLQADSQGQLYYPVNWLLWLLPLPTALQVNVVLHLWLAGAGMYVLARLLGVSRVGSLLAGLAFAGSGQLYTAIEILGVSNIYPWLPWVLAAGEMAWRRQSWAWTAVAGLLFGVLAVSGNQQWFVYSALFLGIWQATRILAAAWDTWRRPGPRGAWRSWAGQTARALAVLAWGPLLAAVQILPFVELLRHSARLQSSFYVAYDSLDRSLRLLVPQFFGNPTRNAGEPLGFTNCWYIGLAPLALALMALALQWPVVSGQWSVDRRTTGGATARDHGPLTTDHRPLTTVLLGTVAVLAYCIAAGLPLFNQFQRLPGFQAQIPQRIAYLFILCAALLAGLGFDGFVSLARRRPWVAAGVAALPVACALPLAGSLQNLHRLSRADPMLYQLQIDALRQAAPIAAAILLWMGAALVLRGDRWRGGYVALAATLLGITVYDLLTYAPGYNTYVRPEALEQFHNPVSDIMRADTGLWRALPLDYPIPNTGILYGFQDVQGFTSLHLARYEDFWAATDPKLREAPYFNAMLRPQNYFRAQADLLNVKYITVWPPIGVVRQTRAEESVGELAEGPIAQSFHAPEHLTSIEVAFDTAGRVNHAPVTLHVRRTVTGTGDLAMQTVDPTSWSGQPWIKFSFPPLDVNDGDPLAFVLESRSGGATARPGDSVLVRASRGDSYPGGSLYQAGRWQPGDLAFVARGTLPAKLQLTYEGEDGLYTNRAVLPRAFVVGAAEVLTASAIPGRIAERGFDPRQAVLLEQAPPPGFERPTGDTAATSPGAATIVRYRNESVDVKVQMDRPGWLVLGDVNYPGWAVEVDGQPAPLYTAYYILRAVPLPAGTHNVHFYFRPASTLLGGAISLLALLAAAIAICGPYRWRHTRPI